MQFDEPTKPLVGGQKWFSALSFLHWKLFTNCCKSENEFESMLVQYYRIFFSNIWTKLEGIYLLIEEALQFSCTVKQKEMFLVMTELFKALMRRNLPFLQLNDWTYKSGKSKWVALLKSTEFLPQGNNTDLQDFDLKDKENAEPQLNSILEKGRIILKV